MTILHPISDFLYELFPTAKGKGPAALVEAVQAFYGAGADVRVAEAGGIIEVRFGAERPPADRRPYQQAVGLCENRRFAEAKLLLEALVQEQPTNSEAHRLLGQVCSELGDNEAAIDHLVDALRWEPKNTHALTLMGNIQAKHRKDTATAMRYYEAALAADPTDHLAANNIAAQFLELQQWAEARTWFQKALRIEPNYPNADHGMAIALERLGDLPMSFLYATAAMRCGKAGDELYHRSLALARYVADALVAQGEGAAKVAELAEDLHQASGKPVRFVADEANATAASLEVAETHGRAEHIVRYKPSYPCVEHLQAHELYHLRYIIEAREAGANELFTAGPDHQAAFMKAHAKDRARLLKDGIAEATVDRYLLGLFHGLNRQIYNAPIDLFIEWDLAENYPDLWPYQFLSLDRLINEAVQATTDPRVVALAPGALLSKSKVYNLTLALHYKAAYGVDRIPDFKAAGLEKELATRLYNEYLEYREDREPGEEYEVVRHWAKDLKLSVYFILLPEAPSKDGAPPRTEDLEDQLSRIQSDPLDQHSEDPERARAMATFQAAATEQGLNMAVVMFMVDALQHFKGMPLPKVKEVALEIAMLGTQGIAPDKQGYKLHHVPGKTFSGNHLLAYYYVSWKLAIPEMVGDLQLPYAKEYGMAVQLHNAL